MLLTSASVYGFLRSLKTEAAVYGVIGRTGKLDAIIAPPHWLVHSANRTDKLGEKKAHEFITCDVFKYLLYHWVVLVVLANFVHSGE